MIATVCGRESSYLLRMLPKFSCDVCSAWCKHQFPPGRLATATRRCGTEARCVAVQGRRLFNRLSRTRRSAGEPRVTPLVRSASILSAVRRTSARSPATGDDDTTSTSTLVDCTKTKPPVTAQPRWAAPSQAALRTCHTLSDTKPYLR